MTSPSNSPESSKSSCGDPCGDLAVNDAAGAARPKSSTPLRDPIISALIEVGHCITIDEVTFYRDQSKDTTALAQICDSLEAAFAGALASAASPLRSWQTIDSAPKDGTPVLVSLFAWDKLDGERVCAVAQFDDGCWVENPGEESEVVIYPPTHWMPLPAAPGASPLPVQGEDAKDAARYRWLRGRAYVEIKCDSPRDPGWSPDALDAAIDAAIRASTPPADVDAGKQERT